MTQSPNTNSVWHYAMVTQEDRGVQNSHNSYVSELSGAGKYTLMHTDEE